ncbi:ATP-binding protein [Crossiella sp. CA-258035]|uniref:NACHT domain-containing protein n=1 Tax=Crossiella sp. CA-258035 TaxID=2981138 RepID=UPI0024BCD709|nr:ATP-binding protein [Crossiella sp. CA-258035]WHT16872.1 ATP-binding protein [Crossiella sp. CA-258035]
MASDPALTYRGALRILGKHNRPWLEKLDKALGGIILAAPAAGLIDPITALAALWGWVDQKNEAMNQLQRTLDSAADSRTGGYERHQLIAAAHTTLVAAAFFETLREQIGEKNYQALKVSRFEEEMLVTGRLREDGEKLVNLLCQAPVRAPGTAGGFEENCAAVASWLTHIASRTYDLLSRLTLWRTLDIPLGGLPERALERYRGLYLRLAADVPEFLVWASFGEYAAIRDEVTGTRRDLLAALNHHGTALQRLETLLTLTSGTQQPNDLCQAVHRANRGALRELVVPVDSAHHWGWAEDIVFPAIEEIYVNPRYRIATQHHSQEIPWPTLAVHSDLDLRLTAHLTSPESTAIPLLVLGHPGAGKSTLTKVLAARLPATSYTVVRVPLRRVDAEAPVYEQIQQALNQGTHGRVDWADLARQSRDTVRVVLFDGLDELLQASATPRSGYLQEVADFQRREADQEHPVVTMVTSRTTVADRVRIPTGTPVIKLEDFDEAQVRSWLRVWHQANPAGGLSAEDALRHLDLTGQPLLLLMLALYAADPDSPGLDADLSRAALYRELLHSFVRREVSKKDTPPDTEQFQEAIRDQLWRLSIAALGMFNRGRQDITDTELGADLAALSETAVRADLGRRTIAEFFFIHSPEARTHQLDEHQRHYEFLHATFGEYLVASQVLIELDELVSTSGRYGLADDPLFALLSHQPLTVSRSTITFIRELADERPAEGRVRITRLLDKAFTGYRQRQGSTRFADYRPQPVDHLRELAAYSANLILLRVLFAADDTPVPPNWQSTVDLWRAGLGYTAWVATIDALKPTELGLFCPRLGFRVVSTGLAEITHARLAGDRHREALLRFGASALEGLHYATKDTRWDHALFSSLLGSLHSTELVQLFLPDLPEGPLLESVKISELLSRLLLDIRLQASYPDIRVLVQWLLEFHQVVELAPHALAAAISAHPKLLAEFPELREPRRYTDSAAASAVLLYERESPGDEGGALLTELREQLPEPDLMNALAELLADSPRQSEPRITRMHRPER